jgi:hypothetical protein
MSSQIGFGARGVAQRYESPFSPRRLTGNDRGEFYEGAGLGYFLSMRYPCSRQQSTKLRTAGFCMSWA